MLHYLPSFTRFRAVLPACVLFFCLLVVGLSAQEQLAVFGVDESAHPLISAKFHAMNVRGRPIPDLSPDDVVITENGIRREVISISCPPPVPPVALSCVLMIDISGSMESGPGSNMEKAQIAAHAWIDALDLGRSECAIATFDNASYLNQDFTTDRDRLAAAIDKLGPRGGTNYDAALISEPAGALRIAARGGNRRVVVLLTDGVGQGNEEQMVQMAKDANVTIYCVTLGKLSPPLLKNVAERTGGVWFESVITRDEAESVYRTILTIAQGSPPCMIQWRSGYVCAPERQIVMEIPGHGLRREIIAGTSRQSRAQLDFVPSFISFGWVSPGTTADTIITVTARNQPVHIDAIETGDPRFTIIAVAPPTPRTLNPGESMEVQIRFSPTDSAYLVGRLLVTSDACPGVDVFFSGGFPGKPPIRPTLRVMAPNGGEELPVGADTVVAWSGIPPEGVVRLEYSVDEGNTWEMIDAGATGLSRRWVVPATPSRRCLLRATQMDQSQDVVVLSGHEAPLTDARFSPDGAWVATASLDSTVRIWNALSGEQVGIIKPMMINGYGRVVSAVRSVEFSPNGLFVLVGCDDGIARIYDWRTGTLLSRLTIFESVRHQGCVAAYSPDGLMAAVGHVDGQLQLVRIADNNTALFSVPLQGSPITSVHFNPDGSLIAVGGGYDRSIRIVDAATGAVVRTLTHTPDDYAQGALWSPDGSRLAVIFSDVAIYEYPSLTLLRTIRSDVHAASFSPDGRYLVTGNKAGPDGGTLGVYEIATGRLLRQFVHSDDGGVYPVWFSPDGGRIVSAGVKDVAKVWDYRQVPLQDDVSDMLWAIVQPVGVAADLDMGDVVVGESRDSVVKGYLCNQGDGPLAVSAIMCEGIPAGEFSVVSGDAPFTLAPGECRAVEFRFRPSALGPRSGQVAITTPSGTIRRAIHGVGIGRSLEARVLVVDFGAVPIGAAKDTVVTMLIRNVGSSIVTVTGTGLHGPDTDQFVIVAGDGAFTLSPGDGRTMTLRFRPLHSGRTSAQIAFDFPGAGSPLRALLFAEGVCAAGDASHTLRLGESSAEVNPGEVILLPVLVGDRVNLPPAEGGYRMAVRINRRVLLPLDSLDVPEAAGFTTVDGDTLLRYEGRWDGRGDTLALLAFAAALGDEEETTVEIVSFAWDWDCPIDIRREQHVVRVKVCREGESPRLFHDDGGELALKPIRPNPAGDRVVVEFSTIETGRTELYLLDALGNRVATVLDAVLEPGSHEIAVDTSHLPSGPYHAVLRTPTGRMSGRMVVRH